MRSEGRGPNPIGLVSSEEEGTAGTRAQSRGHMRTVRRRPSAGPARGQEKPSGLTPALGPPASRWRGIGFDCLSCAVCDILLRQPELRNTRDEWVFFLSSWNTTVSHYITGAGKNSLVFMHDCSCVHSCTLYSLPHCSTKLLECVS